MLPNQHSVRRPRRAFTASHGNWDINDKTAARIQPFCRDEKDGGMSQSSSHISVLIASLTYISSDYERDCS